MFLLKKLSSTTSEWIRALFAVAHRNGDGTGSSFVGRLSERKGPTYLIQAMAGSATGIPGGGTGPDR